MRDTLIICGLLLVLGLGPVLLYSDHKASDPTFQKIERATAQKKAEACSEAKMQHSDAEDFFARVHHRAPLPSEERSMQAREDEACK